MNIVAFTKSSVLTMSSREIAELTAKRHDHVLRDVRTMLISLYGEDAVKSGIPEKDLQEKFFEFLGMGIDSPKMGDQWIQGVRLSRDARGYVSEIRLDYSHTMTLISGYNVKLRKSIIDRWQALEDQGALARFNVPVTYPEAMRLAADLAEQKALVEQQRDEAIATKALIGCKREATAMATASAAKREMHKLEVELDRSRLHATIKRVERAHPETRFNWREMKRVSEAIGIPAIDVFDQNYGTVKSYHAEVWKKAYGIEIGKIAGIAAS